MKNGLPQRGSALGYKILVYIYSLFGYRFLYAFLHVIVLYYMMFARSVKRSLEPFYKRVGVPLGYGQYHRHLFQFAVTILDRFVARLSPDSFRVTYTNDESLRQHQNGAIILVSHVGGWSSIANIMKFEGYTIHVVLKEAYPEQIREIERSLKRKNDEYIKVIDMNDGFESLMKIADALGKGDIVAMMVDRVYDLKNTVKVPFLGEPILINKAPFDLAKKRKIPLFTLNTVRHSVKEYEIIISDPIDSGDIEHAAGAYVSELERIIRKHPDHWFNFYDIWDLETGKNAVIKTKEKV